MRTHTQKRKNCHTAPSKETIQGWSGIVPQFYKPTTSEVFKIILYPSIQFSIYLDAIPTSNTNNTTENNTLQ